MTSAFTRNLFFFFFFNDTATTEIYTSIDTLSLHDALPISNPVIGLYDIECQLCPPSGPGAIATPLSPLLYRAPARSMGRPVFKSIPSAHLTSVYGLAEITSPVARSST